MPEGGTQADAVIQYDSFIDEGCHGKQYKDVKDTPVSEQGPGCGEKQQCGENITLMHFYAEYVKKHKQQSAQPWKKTDVFPPDGWRKNDNKSKSHGDSAGQSPGSFDTGTDDKRRRKQETEDGFNQGIHLLFGTEIPPQAVTGAEKTQQHRRKHMGLVCNGVPVSAQDIVEIGGIDRSIGIGF